MHKFKINHNEIQRINGKPEIFFLKINNIREHIAKIQPKTRFCAWLLTFLAAFFHFFFSKATRLMKKFRFSFIFLVNIFPTTRFFLVLATILTHKNLQLKKSSKTYFFSHLTGINQLICLRICLILCSWLLLVERIDLVNYVIIF